MDLIVKEFKPSMEEFLDSQKYLKMVENDPEVMAVGLAKVIN